MSTPLLSAPPPARATPGRGIGLALAASAIVLAAPIAGLARDSLHLPAAPARTLQTIFFLAPALYVLGQAIGSTFPKAFAWGLFAILQAVLLAIDIPNCRLGLSGVYLPVRPFEHWVALAPLVAAASLVAASDAFLSALRRPQLLESVLGGIIGLALVLHVFGAWKPVEFLRPANFVNALTYNYHFLIAAVGATFVVVTAGIDLSVGSVMAFSCVATALAVKGFELPAYEQSAGVAVGVVTGAVVAMCLAGRELQAGRRGRRVFGRAALGFAIGLAAGWAAWFLLAGRRLQLGSSLPAYAALKTPLACLGIGLAFGVLVWLGQGDGVTPRRRLLTAGITAVAIAILGWVVAFTLAGRESPAVSVVGALLFGSFVGALCGLLNGLFITALGLPPFIVTLASMQSIRGLTLYMVNGTPVSSEDTAHFTDYARNVMEHLRPLHRGEWLGLAPSIWIALGVIAVGIPLLHVTVLGRYAFAIGSNERTARLCGVNVERYKTLCYVIAGITSGLAGALMTAKYGGGQPTEFSGAELTVIAGVVVGGTSLFGGQGTVLGTVLGILMLALLYSGCVIAGISTYVQMILTGAIIVLAAAMDRFRQLMR